MLRLTRILILIPILISVSCTEKGKPIHRHEGDVRAQDGSPSATEPSASDRPSAEAMAWESQFQNAKDPLKEVIVPLSARVLDENRIRRAASLTERSTRDELLVFNRLLLNLSESDWRRPEMQRIGELYTRAVLLDCGDYRDSCTGLRYFSRAANSSTVIRNIAARSREHRLRLLLIAIELKNKLWDQEMMDLLLALPSQATSAEEQKDLDRARSLILTAFTGAAQKLTDKEQARRFLDSVKPWHLLANENFALNDPAKKSILEVVARAGYFKDDRGRAHPDLTSWMEKMKNHPHGIVRTTKQLQNQKNFFPAAVSGRISSVYDEMQFVLDAVMTQTLDAESAAILLKGLNIDARRARDGIENYLRIQFLRALMESTRKASEIFTAPVGTDALLRHALSETATVRNIWSEFESRALPLKGFALLVTREDTVELDKIKSLFESVPRTISRAATYPHMMILFHLLSKKNFEIYIPAFGKSFSSAELIRWLLEGRLPPLFPYSNDISIPNHFGVLHSFDMAVRTGLFASVKIDVDDFISDSIRRIIEGQWNQVNEALTRIPKRLQETAKARDFVNLCRELSGGPKARRKIYFADLKQTPYYGALPFDIYNGMATKNADADGKIRFGLSYADMDFNEVIEIARLDLGSLERMGEAMIATYSEMLEKFILPAEGFSGARLSAELTRRTSKTRTYLRQIRAKREEVSKLANYAHREFAFCYIKLGLSIKDYVEKSLRMEIDYLRSVHRSIKKLRAPEISEVEREQIMNSIRFSGLPSDFKGLDRITETGYTVSDIDLWIRISRYMNQLAPHLQIEFGERLDVDVNHVRHALIRFIPFTESEDEFVASVLKTYFYQRAKYLFWDLVTPYPLSNHSELLKSLISTYRLDHELYGESEVTTEKVLQLHERIMEYLRFTPFEKSLMATLNHNSRIDWVRMHLHKRFLFTDEEFKRVQDTWGLYDFVVLMMDNEQLGQTWDEEQNGTSMPGARPMRQTVFRGGENYFRVRSPRSRGYPLIPFSESFDRQLDRSMSHFVKSEIRAMTRFLDEAENHLADIAQQPRDQWPYVDVDTQLSIREPLLTPAVPSSLRNRVQQFHRATDGFFR